MSIFKLPHFCEFMKDQVWAIRKVCADSFSSFSLRCTREIREDVLTDYFIRLLDDNSRWVKISAYKSLGPFIATFIRSDAEKAEHKKKALLNVTNEQLQTSESSDTEAITDDSSSTLGKNGDQEALPPLTSQCEEKKSNEDVNMLDTNFPTSPNPDSGVTQDIDSSEMSPKKDTEYSDFMFWRNMVPILDKSVPTEVKSDENAMESKENTSSEENSKQKQESSPTLSNLLNKSSLLETSLNKVNIYSSSSNLFSNQYGLQANSQNSIEQLSNELKQVIIYIIKIHQFDLHKTQLKK